MMRIDNNYHGWPCSEIISSNTFIDYKNKQKQN